MEGPYYRCLYHSFINMYVFYLPISLIMCALWFGSKIGVSPNLGHSISNQPMPPAAPSQIFMKLWLFMHLHPYSTNSPILDVTDQYGRHQAS